MAQGPVGFSRPGADTLLSFEIFINVREDPSPIPPDELGLTQDDLREIRNQSFDNRLQRLSIANDEELAFDNGGLMKGDIDYQNQTIELTILFGAGDESSIADITEVAEKFMFIRDQMAGGAIDNNIISLNISSDVRGRFGGPRPLASSDLKSTHIITFNTDIEREKLNEMRVRIETSPDIDLVTLESAQRYQNIPGIKLDRKTIIVRTESLENNRNMRLITNYGTDNIDMNDISTINDIIRDVIPSVQIKEIMFEAF